VGRPSSPVRPALWPAVLVVVLITGCASPGIQRPDGPLPEVELSEVPFHPQSRYQCGPAALATVLEWSGRHITPQALKPRVYVPERRGTLQPEVKAAARTEGRLAYPLQNGVQGLIAEIEAGHPVLVMQNLGLDWLPQWHYAVVIGITDNPPRVVLRSGREKRHVLAMDTFLRTWRRADNWALVVLPAGVLPATARPLPYLQATSELEGSAGAEAALPAFRAGARHWPDDPRFILGLANAEHAAGRPGAALATLKRAVAGEHGDSVMLLNNLAMVAAGLGRWQTAEDAIERALSLDGPYREEVLRTRAEIRCRKAGGPAADCRLD
jgi:hypothetical protein